MKAAYLDPSAAVAVLLQEPGQAELAERVAAFDVVCTSTLFEAELRALAMRVEVPLDESVFAGLRWIHPQRPLTRELERVLKVGYVRGADLWHLACALHVFEDAALASFITMSARQQQIARALGFRAT